MKWAADSGVFDQRQDEIEQAWRDLIETDDDSPGAEELRRLFFGTVLSPGDEQC